MTDWITLERARLFAEADVRTNAADRAEEAYRASIMADMDSTLERSIWAEPEVAQIAAAKRVLGWCVVLGVAAILILVSWQAYHKAVADLRMYETLQTIE